MGTAWFGSPLGIPRESSGIPRPFPWASWALPLGSCGPFPWALVGPSLGPLWALPLGPCGPFPGPLWALKPNKYCKNKYENEPKKPSGYDGVLGWFGKPEAMVTMGQLAMAIIVKPCGTPMIATWLWGRLRMRLRNRAGKPCNYTAVPS